MDSPDDDDEWEDDEDRDQGAEDEGAAEPEPELSLDQFLLDTFGVQGYQAAMNLPMILIPYAARAEHRRETARRLSRLMDASMASGLARGKREVDPTKPSTTVDTTQPYISFDPFSAYYQQVAESAMTREELRAARRKARERQWQEEEEAFARLESALGG